MSAQEKAAAKQRRKAAKRDADRSSTALGRLMATVYSPCCLVVCDGIAFWPGMGLWDMVERVLFHGGQLGRWEPRWRVRLNARRALPSTGREWYRADGEQFDRLLRQNDRNNRVQRAYARIARRAR